MIWLAFALALGAALVLFCCAWPPKFRFVACRVAAHNSHEGDFQVRAQDLLHPVLLENVEAAGRVHDPLQAVPDLPFGHLHAAWQRFIIAFDLDNELWQFRAVRQPCPGQVEVSMGYVLVSRQRPGVFFRVSRHVNDDGQADVPRRREHHLHSTR